jgi:hypothetical protein
LQGGENDPGPSVARPPPICLTPHMTRRRGCTITFVVLATLLAYAVLMLLWRLPWPVSDPAKLAAIRSEAQALMTRYPAKPPEHSASVPKSQWPATIAGLRPELVTVHKWGVDIPVKFFFDGGWGYHIGRSKRELPMPEGCYSEVGPGVFWHGPC